MNAPTVTAAPGAPVISSTVTAAAAVSSGHLRIDDFIKQQLHAADSGNLSGLRLSAERSKALGFVAAANSRYADFLEAFHSSSKDTTERYAARYPDCCFLPWPAFHQLRKSLQLWCDLPMHYTGAVPDSQLPWMEIFELTKDDLPRAEDAIAMRTDPASETGERALRLFVSHDADLREYLFTSSLVRSQDIASSRDIQGLLNYIKAPMTKFWHEART